MHSLGFPIEDFRVFFFAEIVVAVNILTVEAMMMKTAVVAMALEIFTDVGVPSPLVWSI